jgi:hypothetical protein
MSSLGIAKYSQLLSYSLGTDHIENSLQQFLYCCVFIHHVATAQLFYDVTACLLCHCLATDSISYVIQSCHITPSSRLLIRVAYKHITISSFWRGRACGICDCPHKWHVNVMLRSTFLHFLTAFKVTSSWVGSQAAVLQWLPC